MNTSSHIITAQPVISYLDKSSKNTEINSHKNSCEKCLTCNSTAERYPINCSQFFNLFKLQDDTDISGYRNFGLYSCCCFPVTLPLFTVLCGPCTLYNVCRNKCGNNEESKSYLC